MVVRALNGDQIVATKKRNIRSGKEYDQYFPEPTGIDPILSNNARNEDTLREFIPYQAIKWQADTAKIALLRTRPTLEETCRSIWNFIYHHIQYEEAS